MPRPRPQYAADLRDRLVDLVRSGRSPEQLAEEFEPSAATIRNWTNQADRDGGKRKDGLTTDEREELRGLRRETRRLRGLQDLDGLLQRRAVTYERLGLGCGARGAREGREQQEERLNAA